MFTKNEIRDLTISVLALAIIFSHFDFSLMLVTLFIVVIAFASHEILGHKFVAQHYGFDAEYKIWPLGLVLGLVTALIPGGFVIAAPGATYISPYKKGFAFKVGTLSKKQYAIISLAGPLVNIVFAVSLFALNFLYAFDLFLLTAQISFFLAFFNLLPIPPLDGSKIISWSLPIWLVLTAISFAGLFI
jgi:Zn-dependent protease